ncbi:MAG: hypothetical protein R3B72_27070 [Polyangiaceae bacterium]
MRSSHLRSLVGGLLGATLAACVPPPDAQSPGSEAGLAKMDQAVLRPRTEISSDGSFRVQVPGAYVSRPHPSRSLNVVGHRGGVWIMGKTWRRPTIPHAPFALATPALAEELLTFKGLRELSRESVRVGRWDATEVLYEGDTGGLNCHYRVLALETEDLLHVVVGYTLAVEEDLLGPEVRGILASLEEVPAIERPAEARGLPTPLGDYVRAPLHPLRLRLPLGWRYMAPDRKDEVLQAMGGGQSLMLFSHPREGSFDLRVIALGLIHGFRSRQVLTSSSSLTSVKTTLGEGLYFTAEVMEDEARVAKCGLVVEAEDALYIFVGTSVPGEADTLVPTLVRVADSIERL